MPEAFSQGILSTDYFISNLQAEEGGGEIRSLLPMFGKRLIQRVKSNGELPPGSGIWPVGGPVCVRRVIYRF